MNPKKEVTAAPEETSAGLAKYELMVILMPDMSQEETGKHLDKIRKQIKSFDGEIYHEDIWDVRDLAYTIKKQDKGYYAIFYFNFPGDKISELEKDLILDQKIIRHMFVKSPKGYEIKKLSDFELTEEDRKPRRREEKKPIRRTTAAKPRVVKEEKVEEKAQVKTEEKPEVKEEKPEKAKEVAKEEKTEKAEKTEEAPKEDKKEEKAMDISDLDSQLNSILDDPDINIKL